MRAKKDRTDRNDLQITLSPSSIKRFENCKAGYLYVNFILPRIDTKKAQEITKFGRNFHDLAETDFSEESKDVISVTEDDSTMRKINATAEIVKTREYYQYPAVTEEHLIIDVRGKGRAQGYPDRMCEPEDKSKFIIVDYKTTEYPDPWADRAQMVHYAYLAWKKKGIDPSKIELILDYVRSGQEPFVTHTTEQELREYENYLVSMIMKVRRMMQDFLDHGDIKKITHTPGDCNFCPMMGSCIAYQLTVNPTYDPINPQHITTTDLIKELMEREYAKKINEERGKVLKRALIERLKIRSLDPDDPEQRPYKDVIEEFYTLVSSTTTDYPTGPVLDVVLPKRLKKAVKEVAFSGMVDLQVLEMVVKDILLKALPPNLGTNDIMPEDLKAVSHLKVTRPKASYLKAKS